MWTVLGAPFDSSGASRGEERAPAALRAAGLPAVFGAGDAGDVAPPLRDPRRDPATGVMALADLRAATGEAADMELGMLTGDGPPGLVDLAGQVPLVEPADVVILGHRPASLHPDVALELGRVPAAIARMTADEIVAAGPAEVGERWERALTARGRAWLHLDLDVLDEGALPAVSYPQPRGLDWDAFVALARPLLASDALVGVSVADFNPDLDEEGVHALRVVQALGDALNH